MGTPDLPRLPFATRRELAGTRALSLAADTLLVAYVVWCLNFVLSHFTGALGREGWLESRAGFLGERPWLLLLAPLVAVLWQTTGASIGQRLNRLLVLDEAGRPAHARRRALRGVFAAIQAAVALLPAALGVVRETRGGDGGFHYVLTAMLAFAFVALGMVSPLGRGLPDALAGTRTGQCPPRATVYRRPWWQRANPWIVVVVLLLTVAVGAIVTQFDPGAIVSNVDRTFPILGRLFDPDWTILAAVVEKIVETVFLALMASALALPVAFAVSFLGARNIMAKTATGKAVYVLTRVFMNVTRSIEPLVWAIIFILWVTKGPFAGTLALFVHSVAALGKLYSEAIESIDPGPVEAIQATGARPLQVLRYGVVPQVVPPFLSFTIYRWDINVRMATILGLVGGGGIGEMLIYFQRMARWEAVGTILLFITLVVWAMDWASSKARERLT